LSQFTRVTDGPTDGQTDRILIARLRLHSMQRGKNGVFVYILTKSVPGSSAKEHEAYASIDNP